MANTRIGLVGYGTMGMAHARYLAAGEVPDGELTAIADVSEANLARARDSLGDLVGYYDAPEALFDSGEVDGVLIATPHYFHPELAIAAFARGLHVLIEKPAGVHTKHVREMNEAAAASGKVFGIMFHMRTRPIHRKLKDLIDTGQLGPMKRVGWLATDWYRPQAYYDSSLWRATWKGEGGGVLINQCAHQFDTWQWLCGLPKRVRAFCSFGKYHELEVEDDVTAYVEYDNGATGTFITSTGEAPGSNRLEIVGDNGKVVMENDELRFWRLRVPEPRFTRETEDGFSEPECWRCEIPIRGDEAAHQQITANWVDAIRTGAEVIVPGEEGIRSLELSNAMLLSTWTDDWVNLPVDENLFYDQLQERISSSTIKKKPPTGKVMDVRDSW